jgi:hypothetical protein
VRVTIEIDDAVVARLEEMGMSVEDVVRKYLAGLADAGEFERLSKAADGDSHGWKFNREENLPTVIAQQFLHSPSHALGGGSHQEQFKASPDTHWRRASAFGVAPQPQ